MEADGHSSRRVMGYRIREAMGCRSREEAGCISQEEAGCINREAVGCISRETGGHISREGLEYACHEKAQTRQRTWAAAESRWINMTYRIFLYAALVLLIACTAGTLTAKASDAPSRKVVLFQGQTQKLRRKGVSGYYEWSSSDPEIARVDERGRVTALMPGRCKVKVTNGRKSLTYKIRVKALKFTTPNVTMVRGRQHRLTFNYAGVTDAQWTSSDPEIAEVRDGVIFASKAGNAVITALWKTVEVRCYVTVTGISMEQLTQAYAPTRENQSKIVLAGSSSMDYWRSAPQAFAPQEVINTAIEGTTVTQWLGWYPQLITRYRPKAVVLYVGSNDLGSGKGISGEQNAANTILLLDRIAAQLEGKPVFYISVNPCWSRKEAWEKIRVSNNLVESYCMQKQNLYYIDVTKAFARPDGTPDPGLFLEDQLHPGEKGYAVWGSCVVPLVKRTLAALQ